MKFNTDRNQPRNYAFQMIKELFSKSTPVKKELYFIYKFLEVRKQIHFLRLIPASRFRQRGFSRSVAARSQILVLPSQVFMLTPKLPFLAESGRAQLTQEMPGWKEIFRNRWNSPWFSVSRWSQSQANQKES